MSRRNRLRIATESAHTALDRLIVEQGSFDSVEGYRTWLQSGLDFHSDMQNHLTKCQTASKLPLEVLRQRTRLLEQDLCDLGVAVRAFPGSQTEQLDEIQALGFLYVTEGASLGARILLTKVKNLGLSGAHGARHLAYAADQFEHWQNVVGLLENCECRPEDERMLIASAQKAFAIAQEHWRRS